MEEYIITDAEVMEENNEIEEVAKTNSNNGVKIAAGIGIAAGIAGIITMILTAKKAEKNKSIAVAATVSEDENQNECDEYDDEDDEEESNE